MDAAVEQLQTLLELEARHEELLERLDDLDRRVAGVLAQYQVPRSTDPGPRLCAEESAEGLAAGSAPSDDDSEKSLPGALIQGGRPI
jgi:hypothetical protein